MQIPRGKRVFLIMDLVIILFSLTNSHNISPTKYGNNYLFSRLGPSFGGGLGGGHDLTICDNSNIYNASYTNFPCTYNNITTYDRDFFTTSEVEVFEMKDNE